MILSFLSVMKTSTIIYTVGDTVMLMFYFITSKMKVYVPPLGESLTVH